MAIDDGGDGGGLYQLIHYILAFSHEWLAVQIIIIIISFIPKCSLNICYMFCVSDNVKGGKESLSDWSPETTPPSYPCDITHRNNIWFLALPFILYLHLCYSSSFSTVSHFHTAAQTCDLPERCSHTCLVREQRSTQRPSISGTKFRAPTCVTVTFLVMAE